MKKMNNKGFSLVELIVVVLIMAIIAVALAPQVMKWVENSRISTDTQNYDEMVANLQLALTDKAAYAENYALTASNKVTVTISDSNTTFGGTGTSTQLQAAMTKIDANWSNIKRKVTGSTNYTIDIYGGTVYRGTEPSLNADLS